MQSGGRVRPLRAPRKPYCFACKLRRVKCDMSQPVCERCAKNHRRCEYDTRPISIASLSSRDDPQSHNRARQRRLLDCQVRVRSAAASAEDNSHSIRYDTGLLPAAASVTFDVNQRQLYFSMKQNFQSHDSESEVVKKKNHAAIHRSKQSGHSMQIDLQEFLCMFEIGYTTFFDRMRVHLHAAYIHAFLENLATPRTFLVYSEDWADFLNSETNETILNAARACGAVYCNDQSAAETLHTECLEMLQSMLIDPVTTESYEYLKYGVAILFLFNYEMTNIDITGQRFLVHFQGLASVLKAYDARSDTSNASSEERTLLELLVREFRTCECVVTTLFRIEPSITLAEYAHFETARITDSSKDGNQVLVELVCHMNASAIFCSTTSKLSTLSSAERVLSGLSWTCESLSEVMIPEKSHFNVPSLRPFRVGLKFNRVTAVESWQDTSFFIYCETSILRLQMTLPGSHLGQHTMDRADRLAQTTWFLLNHVIQGSFPWLAVTLVTCYETYCRLSSPQDPRANWAKELCAMVVNKVGFGMASILSREIDKVSHAAPSD